MGDGSSWHAPQAVLELAELVLDGALPEMPDVVAVLAASSPPEPIPAETVAALASGPVRLQDVEGTPVAVLTADRTVLALRPFTHGPLRSHRRAPAEVAALVGPGALGVLVEDVPAAEDLDTVIRRAAAGDRPLLWLVGCGAGASGRLAPQALWRAVGQVAAASGGMVVPLALPTVSRHLDPALPALVARAFGATDLVVPGPGGPTEALATHPAFAAELARATVPADRRGLVLLFTGLSGSGKSTIARGVAERLLEDGRRTVTLLDGDEVRRLLSAGLGFSRADRDLNVARIGFVAAEVARHGGLAVCAPIAPFDAARRQVRSMVAAAGADLVLVYVATPLAECERRDRKGLYAAARRGEIADFTGISSPYEPPTDADLVLDTTDRDVAGAVAQVWSVLVGRGHLDPERSLDPVKV